MIQSPLKQSPGVVPENHWGAAPAILAIVNRTTWPDCEFEAPLAGICIFGFLVQRLEL